MTLARFLILFFVGVAVAVTFHLVWLEGLLLVALVAVGLRLLPRT
jgi:hypothetical protein